MELAKYIESFFDERIFKLSQEYHAGKENPWYNVYTKELPSVMRQLVNQLEDAEIKNNYEYEGSIGVGRRAEVFWFGCKHPMLAPTWNKGFYLVYLLSGDGKRLYLSLMLGTEIVASDVELENRSRELYAEKKKITADLRAAAGGAEGLDLSPFSFERIHLGKTPLARAYEIASILSIMYDSKDGVPSQGQLEKDLKNFLVVYKRCRFIYNGKDVPNCK